MFMHVVVNLLLNLFYIDEINKPPHVKLILEFPMRNIFFPSCIFSTNNTFRCPSTQGCKQG